MSTTTTRASPVPGRAGHRGHHDRAVPAPADGLRRLRGRPGQLVLAGQLPPEVRRRRRPGRHRVDAEPHQGPPGRLRQPRSRTASTAATAAPGPSTSPSPAARPPRRSASPSPTPSAARYFSQVFGGGDQALTRSAEAEYNLPLPLGSPLNYFGGDTSHDERLAHRSKYRTRSTGPPTTTAVHVPANTPLQRRHDGRQSFGCGGPERHRVGRGADVVSRQLDAQCLGASAPAVRLARTTTLAPAGLRPPATCPTNIPCNAYRTVGRTAAGSRRPTGTSGLGRYTSGTGNRQCTLAQLTTSWRRHEHGVPVNGANIDGVPSGRRTCADGRLTAAGRRYRPLRGRQPLHRRCTATGNRLCRWTPTIDTRPGPRRGVRTRSRPIAARGSGPWSTGPGQYAANGDAFSARCTSEFNCSSVAEPAVPAPSTTRTAATGTSSQIPAGVVGQRRHQRVRRLVQPRRGHRIMDSTEGARARRDFETEFRVYKQTNPLDFNVRTERVRRRDAAATTPMRRRLLVEAPQGVRLLPGVEQALHDHRRAGRATPTSSTSAPTPSAPPTRPATTATPSRPSLNGDRYANPGPSIYAYADMGINNQNRCARPAPATARSTSPRSARSTPARRSSSSCTTPATAPGRGTVDGVPDEALADGAPARR